VLGEFSGIVGSVHRLAVDPQGRRVAVSGSARGGGWLGLWDPGTGAKVRDLPGHEKWVYGLAFTPDGTRLATGGWDTTIRIWDVGSGAVLAVLRGHRSFVSAVAFGPDGRCLASAGEDRSVRIWDPETGRERETIHGHAGFVWEVAFDPAGRRLFTASRDRTVKVWDITRTGPVALRGHNGWVSRVAFGSGGRSVLTEHKRASIAAAAVDGDPTGDDAVKFFDPETGQEIPEPRDGSSFEDGGRIGDVDARSPGGRTRATVDPLKGPRVVIRDEPSGRVLGTLIGHSGPVNCVAFSPLGDRVATASWDGTIKLWDPANGAEMLTLRGCPNGVNCLAFSPDGRRIVSGGVDGSARVWDATPTTR
jgi:WD40 repeat protein